MSDLRAPLRTPTRIIRVGLPLLLSLALAACATSVPSASPSAAVSPTPAPVASPAASVDPTAIYESIEAQVIDIRGLEPTRPVDRKVLDEAELRSMMTELFDADTPPGYVAANERLYKALGLMPQDANLRQLTLDLLSAGTLGLYRNDQDTLYVVSRSGRIGGNEKMTYAHEYGHALQDQTSTVFADQKDVLDQSDRILARQAAYEGDASLLMTQWAIANLTPPEIQDLIEAASDPDQLAAMERIPVIMRETLQFPYTTGLLFVQDLFGQDDWAAVDGLYDRMPESTEQILHPEKYGANEVPVEVDLPDDLAKRLGTGWTVPLEDTFGELQTRIWLRESGLDSIAAEDAAGGWGGDRLAVLEGPDGSWALAWKTVWDTAADAAAFETPAGAWLRRPTGGTARLLLGTGATRWIVVANDQDTLDHVAGALGLSG